MTKTVHVRGHRRADGTYVRPHSRTIKGADRPVYSSSYSTAYSSSSYTTGHRSGSGSGKAVAAGGGGLLLFVLLLFGIASGGDHPSTVPSPSSSAVQQAGTNP
ncbi:hypothetical protein [Kitasatospora sp. NRRL B-11411]|uniref:hypothetical protein n=1 Tax=Kitasatospora sp. NRRL B-11411 TaxID=1463822 RepID=UPI0004C31EB9|nr:hypothetical protein [Kitasatospora sp. NRRL B-11411]